VLFEASTTSGSKFQEGNERVVCSGLFSFFFAMKKRKEKKKVARCERVFTTKKKKKSVFVGNKQKKKKSSLSLGVCMKIAASLTHRSTQEATKFFFLLCVNFFLSFAFFFFPSSKSRTQSTFTKV
jgi:hypothetical protein